MTATNEQLRDDYSFAFQPIVDTENNGIWAYEALVRGPGGESAHDVLKQFSGEALLKFDFEARLRALTLAARLGFNGRLSMNMLNQSLYGKRDVLGETIAAGTALGFRTEQIILEVSEQDDIGDLDRFLARIRPGRSSGARFALDDFGAGHSGLNLLAGFQPDLIKLDIMLIKDIWKSGPRQAIVGAIMRACLDLGIEVVAEGIEDPGEFEWLWDVGCRLFQGYLFAKPAFEMFALPDYPPFG